MALFERFIDTIFLKESNSLERQIEELKSIQDRVKEKDRIAQDIKLLEYGLYGEKEIAFELKNANLGMYVLSDVILECEGLKAQIDYIIVTKGYTYLVECKNLIGDITVDNKGEFRREYFYNGRKVKESMYSPYAQAERHKDILVKIWLKKSGFIKTLLFEKGFKQNYKVLVVLANSKGILNTKYAPKEIRNCTIRVDNLVSYIKRDLENYDSTLFSSKKMMNEIANGFLNDNVQNYDYSKKYTFISADANVDANSNYEDLMLALKEFRKKKAKEKGIPAYYVFTDDELERMLRENISSLEGLKESKILSETKVKFHGQEIVEILSEYQKVG